VSATKKRGLQRQPTARNTPGEPELHHPVADQPARDDRALIVPISRIHVSPGQPRQTFSDESLTELAEDIRTNGLVNPLTVTQDGHNYLLVAGERRFRALKLLNATEAPVRIIPQEHARGVQLAENIQREDLPLLEEAQALAALRDEQQLTVRGLAELVKKSRSYVQRRLEIVGWPDDVQHFLRDNPGLLTQAAELAKIGNDQRRQNRIANVLNPDPVEPTDAPPLRPPGRPPTPYRFSERKGGGFDLHIKYRPGSVDKSELLDRLKKLILELERRK